MDRAIEIKGLSGWKSKVNKTAWWQGCRWLLQVFQQNEQQFILEQPIGVLAKLRYSDCLNTFESFFLLNVRAIF